MDNSKRFILLLLFACLVLAARAAPLTADWAAAVNAAELHRVPRQIDLTVSADHDDKDDQTELALEAIAGLWRSEDGSTAVEGSAKVVHRTTPLQSGAEDFRIGVRITFTP